MLHGGSDRRDASPYFVKALARSAWPTELSYFSFGLPFAWAAANSRGSFESLVIDMCNILSPAHGYAGLSAIGPIDAHWQSREFGVLLTLARRFSGLEVDRPQVDGNYLESGRIRGINWLTILNRSLTEKVGGAGALRVALGDGTPVHEFHTGVVIQAGAEPLVGDVRGGQRMDAYERVARTLKPIRTRSIQGLSEWNGFDRERTDKWLARFDP
jgi:hypothetical protein